tara:strand:+ start:108 stop:812 length:705 start_codon:yes stop_codon:yes gene_type:complete
MRVDKNIKSIRSNWEFDKQVTKKFDSHVEKSVPFYNISHDIVLGLSDYFLKKGSLCYDIGCSTGTLVEKIYKKNKEKKIKLIGLDDSKAMILKASRKKIKNHVVFKKTKIQDYKFLKCDMVTSLYTIQFLQPKYRQKLFDKIYKSLNWGGAFILFEKIRGDDARFQDLLTFLYYDFKAKNGLKPNEILNKEISLRSVLEPYTIQANIDFMKRAGFKDIMPISQYLCFKGFLAIK